MRKKFLVGIFAAAMICFAAVGMPAGGFAETGASDCDYAVMGGTASAAPTAGEPSKTKVKLSYDSASALRFGEETKDYRVDMSIFDWEIQIDKIEVGQSFTVSFLEDNTKVPFDGAVGVSFVFKLWKNDVMNLYILDAKDGTLLKEMVESTTMWGYRKDGTFEDYKEETGEGAKENYSCGKVGELKRGDGFNGATLTFSNVVDGASFGGTTSRPVISGGNNLGTTVPGTVLTARELNIQDLTLVFSAGGQDKVAASPDKLIEFTVGTPADRATQEYYSGSERMGVVTKVDSFITRSEQAALGTLPSEDYFLMLEEIKNIDLSVLRTRDKLDQQAKLAKVDANLAKLALEMQTVPDAVTGYAASLNALSDLSSVDGAKVAAAESAKEVYNAKSAYIKYLTGEDKENVDNLLKTIDETFLERAKLHLWISGYESSVEGFQSAPTEAEPAQVVAAERARAKILFELLADVSDEDRAAFETRIATCDEALTIARRAQAFDIEQYKIDDYRSSANALAAESGIADFEATRNLRPELNFLGIPAADQEILKTNLASADQLLGTKLSAKLTEFLSDYQMKTERLSDLRALSQKRIDDAVAAVCDKDIFASYQAVAEAVNCDISKFVADLAECDRAPAAAPQRLLAVKYFTLASGDLMSLLKVDAAFGARTNAYGADFSKFTEAEKTAFDELLAEADEIYETAALALINPTLEAFKASVTAENIATVAGIKNAKAKRAEVPSLDYLIKEADKAAAQAKFDEANAVLTSQKLYDVYSGGSSWTVSATDKGILLENTLKEDNSCDGLAVVEDPLDIDGLDMAFEFTKLGRIYEGLVNGEDRNSTLVLNIKRDPASNKDDSLGFSIFFKYTVLNQLEVEIHALNADGKDVLLANGKVEGLPFTADPYEPVTVRIRVEVAPAPLNCYKLWINSLQLTLAFRSFENPKADSPAHIPDFAPGEEVGEHMFKDGKAYLTFVIFAEKLTPEERISSYTIRMLGDKIFGDYVPPVLTDSIELVSGPAKTTYKKGESFDKTGIVMRAQLSDGTEKDIPLSEIKVLGFSSTSKGTKNVTLSYTDKNGITLSKVIKITIVDADPEPEKSGCGTVSLGGGFFGGGMILLAALGVWVVLAKSKKIER